MADEKKEEEEAEEASGGEGAGGGHGPSKTRDPQTMLVLANTVFVLGALGVLVYTKLLFERPAIVEEAELQKRQDELKAPPTAEDKSIITFEQMIVNTAMTSGKAHYATVAFSVEARDEEIAAGVRHKKAIFVDKVIAALGRRQLSELNTIQGKLLLKTELLREFNALTEPAGIHDVYFSTFILQ
jgi:flagellar basal body-associated protein FliL